MMSIEQPSRINFSFAPPTKLEGAKTSPSAGFQEVFEEISANHSNLYYKFTSDTLPGNPPSGNLPPPEEIYNGKLIHMPIPKPFLTPSGATINPYPDGTPLLFPLLIELVAGSNQIMERDPHYCHETPFPDEKGTACSAFMQNPNPAGSGNDAPTKTNLVFFKTQKTQFPKIRHNPLLNFMVEVHNGKDLFFLPTITPNKTVIYVVFEDEDSVHKYIAKYADISTNYFLPLNGFIIYLDDWDCSVYFHHHQIFDMKKINEILLLLQNPAK